GWRVHLRRMHERPTPELLNREMERLVLALPDQYLWGYNRYKGAPPEPAAGVAAS
ncbi:MAG TPA: lysophospholipid acyltransferase family protein, partial [Burkholderiaceae bacterium]|nr:lysophospholipid acyltransferase family protein [Burkholderiaceae bacterium]